MRRDLTVAEAQREILEATSVLGVETVLAADALGRTLAEPVVSSRTLPPADNSAMDGYAVRAADLAGASADAPVPLELVGESAAGGPEAPAVGTGQAVRIFTGAPLPAGADSVVRQEDTRRDGDRVHILVSVREGLDVRRAGEDVSAGDRVLEAGTTLGPAHLGMLAAVGRTQAAVHRRPRVAVLSGGDELVEPDGDVSGGRIVSSNSYALAAQCREIGAETLYLGIARDDPADLERRLGAGRVADAIVTSAGVSVGDRDHVRGVLQKLGASLLFWGVKMKPGYPFVFARFVETPGPLVFGLPGNPVSAMVTFEQLVRPALLKMSGRRRLFRRPVDVRLGETFEKKPGRLHFVRVRLERRGGELVAFSTGTQSSGVLRSMCDAHGLLVFPAEADRLAEGGTGRVQLLDERFLASSESGL